MKKTPLIVLFTVLFAGMVAILGCLILLYNIDKLSRNYRVIVEEHDLNRIYMARVSGLAYEHQSIVAKHLIASDTASYDVYEAQCAQIKDELKEELETFGVRMDQEEEEQLYHKVYSNINSYISNADVALSLSREGSKATAFYYYDSVMNQFLGQVTKSIEELDDYTVSQLNEAKEQMNDYINTAEVVGLSCVICVAVFAVISILLSVRVTSNLDKYKNELELEVEKKTETIRIHNEKLMRIQDNTIMGMANLIESRDGDTGGHIKRTSRYVNALATAAKKAKYCQETLTDNYIELLTKAAPMHDIGKIAVSDVILQKPGKLTFEEFERIKCHAAEGGKILREVLENIEESEYVNIAAQVASGHHEHWDGTGYPLGLKGEDIPLCARIMAIADVFDALVSKRCYKEAMSTDEAFDIIRESAGSHFDPALTKIFLNIRDQVEEIVREYRD